MPFVDINDTGEYQNLRLYDRLPEGSSNFQSFAPYSSDKEQMPGQAPVKGLLLRVMAANDESDANGSAMQINDVDRWSRNSVNKLEGEYPPSGPAEQDAMHGKMGLLNRFSYSESRSRNSNLIDSDEQQEGTLEYRNPGYQNNFTNIYPEYYPLAYGNRSDVDAWSNQAMGFGENPNSPISSMRFVTASKGDNISSLIGKSDPRDIGNFMQANTLDSSRIHAGKAYFIPQNSRITEDAIKIGQRALDIDNARQAPLERPSIYKQDLSTSEIEYISKMLDRNTQGNINAISRHPQFISTGGLQASPFGDAPHYGAIDVRGRDESLRTVQRIPKEIPTNYLQPGETIKGNVFFGGAGMDGPYIQDMVRAFDQHGIKLTPASTDTWSYGTLLDAGPGVQAYRYGRHPFPTPLDKFEQSGSQFNLIGYSYGSEVAAQVAVNYAKAGTKIDNLVLIASPISDDFFKTIKNTKNINNVIVLDLEKQGDPIKAGIPLRSLIAGAPTLVKQMLAGNGEGHFYYAPDSDAGNVRRNALAEHLYKKGVR